MEFEGTPLQSVMIHVKQDDAPSCAGVCFKSLAPHGRMKGGQTNEARRRARRNVAALFSHGFSTDEPPC